MANCNWPKPILESLSSNLVSRWSAAPPEVIPPSPMGLPTSKVRINSSASICARRNRYRNPCDLRVAFVEDAVYFGQMTYLSTSIGLLATWLLASSTDLNAGSESRFEAHGWKSAAARDEIRPEFVFNKDGGPNGAGCLSIRA